MKKLKKFLLCLFMCTLLISQSISSYAWESAEGDNAKKAGMDGAYRIQNKRQGWLIYWIDDTQHVVSDIALVGRMGVLNEFTTADYKCVWTRWENKGFDYPISITDMHGMPTPFDEGGHETTNAPEMKAWMAKSRDFLISILNAPEDIKTTTEEDKYFFIAEPVYMFALFSPVKGVKCENIVGTTYQYSNYIINNLLGSTKYPTVDKKDGLSMYGWSGTCRYTNGNYGTFECVGKNELPHMTKIGITVSGEQFFNRNTDTSPYSFAEFADRKNGLGIVIKSNSDKEIAPPENPDPREELLTTPYVGEARPDTYTYHYSENYNLDKNNNPKGRIPSGEMLTNGIDVDTWFCNYTLTKHSFSFQKNLLFNLL